MSRTLRNHFTRFLLASVIAISPVCAEALPPLKVVNGKITNPAGDQVTLKGCNLGNWLIIEPWMFSMKGKGLGAGDEHGIEALLDERFGEEERERLMKIHRDSYITERDFPIIRSFGMNFIRLPFEYELLENDEKPMSLRPDAFEYLARGIDWSETHGMYVMLDLHGAAGRQNKYAHSGHADQNKFWTTPEFQERTLWLWGEIARRYANRGSVMGYEPLNEPWHGGSEALLDFTKRWYAKVRPLAPEKILVMPGMSSSIEFYGDPKDHGWKNVMFDMHWYPGIFGWGKPGIEVHRKFLVDLENKHYPYMRNLGVPMLHGECNIVHKKSGGGRMTRIYFDRYERYGWVPAIWSYKNMSSKGGIPDNFWGMVANKQPMPALDLKTAPKKRIESFFRNFSTMEYAINEDLRHWLTTDEPVPTIKQLAAEEKAAAEEKPAPVAR